MTELYSEARRIEQRLHEKYAVLRGIGEWFLDAPELLAEFDRWDG